MRTPPSAGLAEVELDRAAKQSGSWPLGAHQSALWGAALGSSLALLLVRLSFTWGGPAALAGPAAVGLAGALGAFLGMLAGLALARSPAGRRRIADWALALGALWLLILYPAVGPPAVIAAAGFSLALLAARTVGRSRSVAGVSGRGLILAGGVGLTALVLYWPRLARQVVPGDSGEFQALIPSLGIPHPTGYPLYVLIGKAFTLLPLGEPAFSLSLLSALWAAGTAAGVVLLALDLGRDELAAGLAAGLVALSPLFVQQAIVPEVYALHLLLLVFILWLTGRWQRSRSPITGAGIALLVGLGLAHHRTILLVIPSLIMAWLLAGRPAIRARVGLAWVLTAALPLLTYLYFPWRWPAVTGQGITPAEFRALVFADRFQTLVDPAQLWSPERYALLVTLLAEQLTGVGLLLGVAGLAWAVARRPAQWLPLAALALVSLWFAAIYRVPDVAVFLLPVQLVLALGAAAAVRSLRIRSLRIGRSGLARGAGTLALAAIVLHQIGGWRSATALPDVQAETEAAISAVPPGPALIISDVERFTPLLYASRVMTGRRDIEVIMPDTHDQAFDLIEAARGSNRTVLLARHLPRLTDRYSVQSAGPLVAIDPAPAIDPGPVTESAAATHLRLARATVPERARRGDQLGVELEWWLEQPIVEAWRPVLAVADADGRIRAAEVARDPVAGLFPFPLWQAGQRVRDYHQVALPDDLPTGRYDVWLLLLRPGERTPERVSDYLPGGAPLARVHVEPSYQAPDGLGSTLLAIGGDLRLLDYRLPATVEAGRPAEVQLLWQAGSRTPARRLLVELGPGAGPPVGAEALLPPLTPGETLVTRVTLPAVGVGLWPLHLMVEETGRRLPIRSAWYRPAERSAELATLQVVPPAPTVPTFDDRIQLLGAEHPSDVTTQDTLSLRLRWQAIAAPRSDYTVFVHLVDEQGVVRAQVDSRPRQGTLLTTHWPLATVIDDRYEIPLRNRLPPGQYRLVIGLYDARTMIRLPVTDPDGRPIADHLDLGSVNVTGGA